MNLEPGDKIKLSDGNTYLFLFPLTLRGKEYLMFSPENDDKVFRLGKYIENDDKKAITFIYDEELIKESYDYIQQHRDEILDGGNN